MRIRWDTLILLIALPFLIAWTVREIRELWK